MILSPSILSILVPSTILLPSTDLIISPKLNSPVSKFKKLFAFLSCSIPVRTRFALSVPEFITSATIPSPVAHVVQSNVPSARFLFDIATFPAPIQIPFVGFWSIGLLNVYSPGARLYLLPRFKSYLYASSSNIDFSSSFLICPRLIVIDVCTSSFRLSIFDSINFP